MGLVDNATGWIGEQGTKVGDWFSEKGTQAGDWFGEQGDKARDWMKEQGILTAPTLPTVPKADAAPRPAPPTLLGRRRRAGQSVSGGTLLTGSRGLTSDTTTGGKTLIGG